VAPPAVSVDIRERRSGDLYRVGLADTLAGSGDGGDKAGISAADHTIEALAETYMTRAHANEALLRTDMLAGASLAFRQRWPCGR
jgi:hypothetical protein